MGGAVTPVPTPPGELNNHDRNVIYFHALIAVVQAVLLAVGPYTYLFGKNQAYVALAIQVIAEVLRRLVV